MSAAKTLRVASSLLCVLAAGSLRATTFTVTTTADSGAGSLRQAILDANTNPGSDTIAFSITGSGVHTIQPAAPLPMITGPVTIDGYTQPGSSPNSNGPGLGDNSIHLIEIDGTNTGGGIFSAAFDFRSGSDGSVVRGLVINRCPEAAIQILIAGGHLIEGNFIGTDPTGTTALGIGAYDILIDEGASNVTVGGTAASARNLISGGALAGVAFGNDGSAGGSGHVVEGNFIGTDASGTAALANDFGISMAYGVTNSTIGGTTPAARNVISGNAGRGIIVSNSLGNPGVTGNVIEGNFLGTDVTGTLPLGNGEFGVEVNSPGNTVGGSAAGAGNVIGDNSFGGIGMEGGADGLVIQGNFIGTDPTATVVLANHGPAVTVSGSNNLIIGGVNPGEANLMAFNGVAGTLNSGGILIYSGTGNAIRGNSIHDNQHTGIDLGGGAPHPNDSGDADSGANNLQNFPLISSVAFGANTEVTGVLHSTPATMFQLDFYANPACSSFPRDFLQGETYLGSSPATTDGSGNVSFDVMLPATTAGSPISVTATDPSGNTSEFSQRLPFSINIASGPASGGTAVTVSGTDFDPAATVTIGGQPATGVNVASSTSLSATTPALSAGSANDLVVMNPDGTNGTLVKGWVADFLDVPNFNQFYFYVTKLVSNAITAGVGGGNYGVDQSTLRQQMAVFLLRGEHGLCYAPPPCTGVFADVPCPSTFAPWIEALAAEGITGGCGGGNFCPTNPVRRDQMAPFLLKAEHGSKYVPPACTGVFLDVPCPSLFADWVERLAAENITGGCGGGNYCPQNPATRGQMAVFVVKTFNLQ